ncbi:biotin/lipoyl-binding protein, partial [Nostoc sp. NIES-2111]
MKGLGMSGAAMKKTLVVVAMAALAACGGKTPEKKAAAEGPAVRVQTVEVSAETWPLLYEAAGTVRARTSATLSSRVMGYVREIRVQPGDRVNAGQLVATLESRELESGVKQAQAAEVEARSAVAEAEQAIAAARAQTMLAKSTFERMDSLHKKKSISEQEFEEVQARLRTAEATLEMAQAKRKQLDARIAQARQGVEAAETMLGFTKIYAPFAGLVT